MTWHGTESSTEMRAASDAAMNATMSATMSATLLASALVERDTPRSGGGLGTAVVASGSGRWSVPVAPERAPTPLPLPTPSAPARHQLVRVPRDLLRMMSEAAWATGRGEEEIWIEAAREWLRRRLRDDEPPPTAPASAWPSDPRITRTWAAIDALVAELRPTA